ncbi:Type II restriction enzyme, methylase subunit YeeA [Microcystis aeruginosa NIES-2549]|uniref:site-specific DNA-methyltransferase (adenine-specific) n=1 Tax=Microcystis aeruginosa NIES-2549 TaxID=1641812 RepID=A0A0F6U4D7_MICAE|nr:DNA methyltransferase [Microcystis aeruginosa]AKE64471.1 Type II restriction enzyme, methylase subunit YeeA [Microcystis aeruginosa NIES-2549]AOC52869.1 Type II restriction enzyme, methylase subunit YeeA [Microcystis aeruginosa NIES-2481]
MPLSWNEIKNRAIAFQKEWQGETSEKAESQSFWNEFFHVFGISRRRVASFEQPIKKADNKQGFIDLLWKGTILVEHKSKGKDLEKAPQQAKDYFPNLKEHELPRYILVSDFQRFKLYDLDSGNQWEFELSNFVDNVHLFDFIAGYEKRVYKDEDSVNIQAAELMGKLHDCLKEIGYMGHDLEVYLVRLLFCLFADDTGIFNQGIFWEYIDIHTKEDGSDLAMHIASIFQVLNTPEEKRLKNIDENLTQFPYINGKLFEESLPLAAFDSKMRVMLLEACAFDWGKISPAIFGSMFQAVMNPKERRNLGAHYTSEKNIQKVIKPLFLDDLHREFEKIKGHRNKLLEFHKKIANLYFLDPACGCGNFLIITYRELRDLEILVLQELDKTGQLVTDISAIIQVDVNQFAGIEYDEFAVRVAEVAMGLIDHQMNIKVSNTFGQYFVRLPLKKAAKIVNGNALRIDWEEVISKEKLNFILGNPPFVGKQLQNADQKADMNHVLGDIKGAGVLDYVTAWYIKAAEFIQNSLIRCALVSTNSISQGEQVGIIWQELYQKYKIKIHFAHRTFSWSNEAKGNAAVHCVIIGFGLEDIDNKRIFDYADIKGEPTERKVKNINPYLVEGNDLVILSRRKTISSVPEINFGSMPNDGGHLILLQSEKEELVKNEPDADKWIRRYTGAQEFINGYSRYCLWLADIQPQELKKSKEIYRRVEEVRKVRSESNRKTTQELSKFPTLFGENRQPDTNYLLVPRVSSERRKYIPIGFFSPDYIASDSCLFVANADLSLFGILTSEMHMAWVKYVCGRLKSDYRYSNTIVYNNFPFPENITDKQKQTVETCAQAVLDTRAKYPDSSLADLYDHLTMPPDLLKAHQKLDKAVDLCYRPQLFTSELNRIEYLFELYEKLTAPLLPTSKQKATRRKNYQ